MALSRNRKDHFLDPKILREVEKYPVLIVRTDFRRVADVIEGLTSMSREREIPVSLAIVPGSIDVIVMILVEISQNPTVAAAVGALVGSIAGFLRTRRLGRIRGKNRALAITQVEAALHEDGSYIAEIRNEHIIEGHGYHFILVDNRRRLHDFTIAHKCDIDHELIQ